MLKEVPLPNKNQEILATEHKIKELEEELKGRKYYLNNLRSISTKDFEEFRNRVIEENKKR